MITYIFETDGMKLCEIYTPLNDFQIKLVKEFFALSEGIDAFDIIYSTEEKSGK